MNEARKNKNEFPYDELKSKLIYNYPATYVNGDYFTQVYLFDESKLVNGYEKTEKSTLH